MDIRSYISGYVDGEGCFSISIRPRPKNNLKWEVIPSFAVAQNEDKIGVLKLMKDYFGYGSFRPNKKSDKTLKFEIRSISVLTEKVIPHFKRYPLQSGRQKDVEIFSQICQKIKRKEHLTKKGLIEIVRLRSKMSFTSKRIYTQNVILRSLSKMKI